MWNHTCAVELVPLASGGNCSSARRRLRCRWTFEKLMKGDFILFYFIFCVPKSKLSVWVSTEGWIGGQTQELACSAKSVVSPCWNGIKALVQQSWFWQVEARVGTIALFSLYSIPLLLAFQKKRGRVVSRSTEMFPCHAQTWI